MITVPCYNVSMILVFHFRLKLSFDIYVHIVKEGNVLRCYNLQ